MAVYIDNLRLMDAMSGEEITRIPLDDAFRARFRNPYAVVHRGDLFGVFLKAAQTIRWSTSAPTPRWSTTTRTGTPPPRFSPMVAGSPGAR
jgi:hypothetical protein